MKILALILLATAACVARAERIVTALDGNDWTLDGLPVLVPNSWNKLDASDGWPKGLDLPYGDSSVSSPGYARRTGTYRRALPSPRADRRYFVRCEAASSKATVRVNGRAVGSHVGAFTAFCFEITDALRATGNVLEIEVSNIYDPTVPPASGDFSLCGGLYRSVSLIETPPVCIDPTTDGSNGVTLAIDTNGTVVATVRVNARGTISTETQSHVFADPELWTPELPKLYSLHVEIASGDAIDIPFAFRTAELRADGFYLNGVRRKLRGVNRHQDIAGKGWAVSAADEARDILLIKEMGADALRTAHYPQSRHIYDLCDRLGLICWVEYPNVNRLIFTDDFEKGMHRQIREMVAQLGIHPSIAMWSICNELEMAGKGWKLDPGQTVALLTRTRDLIRSIDPSRPVVSATDKPKARLVNDVTDQLAYNRYPGWYAKRSMREMLDEMFAADDRRILGMSEYGVGGSVRQHGNPTTGVAPAGPWHPEEYQAYRLHDDLLELTRHPGIWGHYVWAMFDFAADRRTEGDRHGINDKGLMTHDHKVKKDAYYLYRANWTKSPTLHLVGSRMTSVTNSTIDVMGFSNVGPVTLRVNGVACGTQTPDVACGVLWRDVPLNSGTNRVELNAGRLTRSAVWRFE